MLKFAIGLGIWSLSGAKLERYLLKQFEPDCFVIEPIKELPCKEKSTMAAIQARVGNYAGQVKGLYQAEMYIGIASGIAPFEDKTGCRSVWHDLCGTLKPGEEHVKMTWRLNVDDVAWQMKHRLCATATSATHDPFIRFCYEIEKWCKQKTSP